MAEYALRLANSVDTAARVRMGHALGLFPLGALNARSGLRNDLGGAVTVVAGQMKVNVSSLLAWVDGGASNTQSGYPFVLDATKQLTLADGDAVNPRIDTIAIVVNDTAFDGSGSTQASVQVVQGTPAASPVAPTLPTNSLPLRDVLVPAGRSAGNGGLTNSELQTDRRQWLATGVLRVSGQAERDALTPNEGLLVYRSDTGLIEARHNGAWIAYKQDDGKFTQDGTTGNAASTAGGSSVDLAVTFPTAYSSAPTVVVSSLWQWFVATVVSVSATGFTVRFRNYAASGASAGTPSATWVAVGPR